MTALQVFDHEDVEWFRDDVGLASAARGAAATLARRVGLDSHRSSEVALAVTEAATNLHRHAADGALLLRVLRTESSAGIECVAVDTGPGMADVAEALLDGTSTAGTLGIGLGAMVRLADAFDIHSIPGRGTVLAAQFWARDRVVNGTRTARDGAGSMASGLTRPISGETSCGDAWAVRVDAGADQDPRTGTQSAGDGVGDVRPYSASRRPDAASLSPDAALLVMLCDGLGHGPLAALASEAAVGAFRRSRARHPEGLLRDIHAALRGTRGGAVAVARVEPSAGRLLYCGIGNVSGFLLGPESRSGLMSAPGIVGQHMRSLRTFEAPLEPGGALVMHSDGLSERWSPGDLPGLLRHSPAVVAGQLLREAGVRRDDAGIVVVKGAW
jgi:anti-sigma regulatory factor (Ser/Thr protein kinase)